MGKSVAFLAETPGSPTIERQQLCLDPDDIEVLAGRKTFNQLTELLERKGIGLEAGDRVKVHDLSCLAIATPMLVRAIAKLLRNGVSFEICTPRIVVEPGVDDKLHAMLDALDTHYRHIHGIKTHPAEMSPPGRKRLLGPDKLPEIRERLSAPGATATDVAQELGVARSTLFNYLERYDLDRRAGRQKKGVNRHTENGPDDRQVAESERDETAG
ncbi:helix-turn-helix domain-containing protein [Sphingomonas sp. TREG-RG-20F-R18-01]|uniref:helix-turn-helix domain-containing protein n=1 Tax=Sphingomonas sp. TREG-RG-20F-R18-01 TaxID=2914982 RepID=UPI001F57EE4E|nr:helix-turn-helix domain-containing protein [Sphingomonas sp. TREG-RG-20F-R18-01]